MPNINTHVLLIKKTLYAVSIPIFISAYAKWQMIFIGAGLWIGTYWLHPDLDQAEHQAQKLFSWKACWIIYGEMIAHRSIWSHGVLIGTFIRHMYLFFVPYLIVGIIYLREVILVIENFNIYFFFGNAIADMIHLMIDLHESKLKKRSKHVKI